MATEVRKTLRVSYKLESAFEMAEGALRVTGVEISKSEQGRGVIEGRFESSGETIKIAITPLPLWMFSQGSSTAGCDMEVTSGNAESIATFEQALASEQAPPTRISSSVEQAPTNQPMPKVQIPFTQLPIVENKASSQGYPRGNMYKWEYRHEFIEAQKLEGTGERGFLGLGAEKMRNVYAWDEINQQLNVLGADGWELIQADPHWIWGNMTFGAPLWAIAVNNTRRKVEGIAAYPEYIVGWYCTFRRPVG